MSEFAYSETRVADKMGIARATVRTARLTALVEGDDWRMDHHEVIYCAEGVQALLKALGVRIPKKRARTAGGMTLEKLLRNSLAEMPAAPAPTTQAVLWRPLDQVLVVRRLTKNRRILLAEATDAALAPKGVRYRGEGIGLLRVQVRDNRRFSVGMAIPCRHVQADLWEMTGPLPRGPRDNRFMPGAVS